MNTTSESLLIRLVAPTDDPDASPFNASQGINQSAWRQFVELYTPLIFTWAHNIGLNTNDASDLVQDVLTLTFEKLPSFQYDRTKSFRAWLRTVTVNRYRETIRRKSANQAVASHSVLEQMQGIDRAESTWDLDYAKLLVAQAMEGMRSDFAESTWQALKLVVGKNLSVEQAAAKTDVSPWTIYSAKSRLLRRLRDELDGLL